MSEDGAKWSTTDLGTAAFAHMNGLELIGARRENRGRFKFEFRDPGDRGPDLAVDYLNSDCRKFDAAVRSLKKLCHDGGSRRTGGRT